MAPHSGTLAWKIPWMEEPGGCSPGGREESDMTERRHFRFSLSCIGEGNGNPLQCSCLENPRDGGAWWAAVYGVAQSWTRLKWLSSNSDYITSSWRLAVGYSFCPLLMPFSEAFSISFILTLLHKSSDQASSLAPYWILLFWGPRILASLRDSTTSFHHLLKMVETLLVFAHKWLRERTTSPNPCLQYTQQNIRWERINFCSSQATAVMLQLSP